MAGRADVLVSSLTVFVAILSFAGRAWRGLWFFGFDDETAHLLGGWVINSGGVLYRDFVDNHGPVIYMLSAAYGALFGWSAPNFARLIPILLILGSGAAVGASPALTNWNDRRLALALFFGLTGSVWLLRGFHLFSFYPVAGACAVVVVALFWVPICIDAKIPDGAAFLAGLAAALLGFTAYCYMPTSALFAASGLWAGWRRGNLRPALFLIAGGASGSALVLAWLILEADFTGYVAFHIALNQTAFAEFTRYGVWPILSNLKPWGSVRFLVEPMTDTAFVVQSLVLIGMIARQGRRAMIVSGPACVLGLFAMAMLNPRGLWGFHDGPFILGTIGFLAVIAPAAARTFEDRAYVRRSAPFAVPVFMAAVELTLRHAPTSPHGLDREAMDGVPVTRIAHRAEDPRAVRIRSIVPRGETFLALAYQPELYWAADRLPMPGFFAYLPWDAVYARDPWFGRAHDLCAAVTSAPPKLIVLDEQSIEASSPRAYMPCLFDILAAHYHEAADFPAFYIRSDISDAD